MKARKMRKIQRKLLIFILAASFILGQCMSVQAAVQKKKYFIHFHKKRGTHYVSNYTPKFKKKIVRLYEEEGRIYKSITAEYGVISTGVKVPLIFPSNCFKISISKPLLI